MHNAIKGHDQKHQDEAEFYRRISWQQTRWLGWINWNLHVTRKCRINKPENMMKFDWEKMKSSGQKPPTKRQKKAMLSAFPDTLDNVKILSE